MNSEIWQAKFLPSVEVVLFDLDGTSIDSKTQHLEAWIQTFAEYCPNLQAVDGLIGGGDDLKIILSVMENVSINGAFRIANTKAKKFAEIVNLNPLKLTKGFLEFAKKLKDDGIRIAGYTNCSRQTADFMLSNTNISDLFETCLSAGDVLMPKPSGEGYTFLCERYEVSPSKVVVFEDSLTGVVAASEAKIPVIYIGNPTPSAEHLIHESIDSFEDLL